MLPSVLTDDTSIYDIFGTIAAGFSYIHTSLAYQVYDKILKKQNNLTIASVIYFAVIIPMNKVMAKMKSGKTLDQTEKSCPECLSLIPIKALTKKTNLSLFSFLRIPFYLSPL